MVRSLISCTAAVFEQEKKNSFFQSSGLFSLKGAGIWRRINSPVCVRAELGTVRAPPSRLRSAERIPDGAARASPRNSARGQQAAPGEEQRVQASAVPATTAGLANTRSEMFSRSVESWKDQGDHFISQRSVFNTRQPCRPVVFS